MRLPIIFVGLGEKADDLQPFSVDFYLDSILPEANEVIKLILPRENCQLKSKGLKLNSGERSYAISVGSGFSGMLTELKERFHHEGRKIAALVDEGLAIASPTFLDEILSDVPTLKIPFGRGFKIY